jgi:hypothetical protein
MRGGRMINNKNEGQYLSTIARQTICRIRDNDSTKTDKK